MRGINLEGLEAKLEELQGVMKSLEQEARDLMQVYKSLLSEDIDGSIRRI